MRRAAPRPRPSPATPGTVTSIELAAERHSPRTARHLVREFLPGGDDGLVATVELLVTELVTNAIVHTASAPLLEVEVYDEGVRVAVHDHDPTVPTRRTPDRTRPGGRGIVLLEELSSRWGVQPAEDGKVVWFEVERGGAATGSSGDHGSGAVSVRER